MYLLAPSQIVMAKELVLVVIRLCGADWDVLRRVYKVCVYDAIWEDHDSPMKEDLEWFDPSHANRFKIISLNHVGKIVDI